MVIKIRKSVLLLLFLLGVFSLYLGFYGTGEPAKQEAPKTQREALRVSGQGTANSAVFVNFRQNRENNRQQQIDLLTEVINNNNVSQETRQAAQKKLLALNETIAKEGEIENMVLAKGFKDVAATVASNNINLMVYGEQLTTDEITRLQDIVVRCTGIRLEHIVIVPRK